METSSHSDGKRALARADVLRYVARTIVTLTIATGCTLSAYGKPQSESGNQAVDASPATNGSLTEDSSTVQFNAATETAATLSAQRPRRTDVLVGLAFSFLGSALAYFIWQRRKLRRENEALRRKLEHHPSGPRHEEQFERRLARMQRMDILGTLAGKVAHDLNNILVGVLCNAELLKIKSDTNDEQEACIDGIIQSAEAARELGQTMISYSGAQPAQTATIELGELVARMKSDLNSVSQQHKIELVPPQGAIYAKADATQIEQVLLNLVKNAVKASEDQAAPVSIQLGTVTLNTVDEKHFYGRRCEGGPFAFIEVSDSGHGIAGKHLERIFDPFFADESHGRGMGLAIAYGNIVSQNGLIECHSQVGEGTTMRILLPAEPAPAGANEQPPSPVTPVTNSGHAVVIDDEPSVLLAMERILVSHGWTCEMYDQPRQALAKLESTEKRTDCVVVDVRMPDMDGRTVVEHLLEHHPRLPVAVVSGHSPTNLHDFRTFPNVIDTLEKPFSTDSVMDSLQQAARMSQAY